MTRFALLFVTATHLVVTSQLRGAEVGDGRIVEAGRTALLPLRLTSDEGVIVVYDAAVPATDRDPRLRYMGWWLGANDSQVYVYSALVYHSYDAVEAMIDLWQQFGVDLVDTKRDLDQAPCLEIRSNRVYDYRDDPNQPEVGLVPAGESGK